MSRFVILRHQLPPDDPRGLHWDLMFEVDGQLWTWALPESPDAAQTVVAERLADHRLAYLDYEGPVSNHRGTVARWDAGTFSWIQCDEAEDEPQRLVALLDGTRGRYRVTLDRSSVRDGGRTWRITFDFGAAGDDEFAGS